MFDSNKLKRYLEENKISNAKFGDEIGTSGTMVSYLARGYRQPSAALLKRIAEAMGTTMEDLMA